MVLPLTKEAHELQRRLNTAIFKVVEHDAKDLSFTEVYKTAYFLGNGFGGALVQRSLRHAARAISVQPERLRKLVTLMLYDITMYHQRTWVVSTQEKDAFALVEHYTRAREAKALLVLERVPRLWRTYMREVFWPPGGVYEQRTAKRARWNTKGVHSD